MKSTQYSIPGPIGGRLIRTIIADLRRGGLVLPLTSDIHIGYSGGADSTALATLIARYGLKICKPTQIKLLHINHHWQEGNSSQAEAFCSDFAKKLKVKLIVQHLKMSRIAGESLESVGHFERHKIFNRQKLVFTAHHEDDLAETVLWRILTGATELLDEGGIRQKEGVLFRPFLRISKKVILGFLKEENQIFYDDPSNENTDFLRNAIRHKVMPELRSLFSNSSKHLANLPEIFSQKAEDSPLSSQVFEVLLKLEPKLRVKRSWHRAIQEVESGLKSRSRVSISAKWELSVTPNLIQFKRRDK